MTDTFTVTLTIPGEKHETSIGRAIILTPTGRTEDRILLPSQKAMPRTEANLRLRAIDLIREMFPMHKIHGEYMPYHFHDRATGSHVAVVCVEADHIFRPYEPIQYALDDCINYATNNLGDCGGRIEEVGGQVICENCRNRPYELTM
jgi:hypothetical protein